MRTLKLLLIFFGSGHFCKSILLVAQKQYLVKLLREPSETILCSHLVRLTNSLFSVLVLNIINEIYGLISKIETTVKFFADTEEEACDSEKFNYTVRKLPFFQSLIFLVFHLFFSYGR